MGHRLFFAFMGVTGVPSRLEEAPASSFRAGGLTTSCGSGCSVVVGLPLAVVALALASGVVAPPPTGLASSGITSVLVEPALAVFWAMASATSRLTSRVSSSPRPVCSEVGREAICCRRLSMDPREVWDSEVVRYSLRKSLL